MGPNAVLSFLLEIAALAVYGWVPFGYPRDTAFILKLAMSVVLIVLVVVPWSQYAAPRATHRLGRRWLLPFKALVFLPAVLLAGLRLGVIASVIGLILVCGNLLVEFRSTSKPAG